MPRRGAGARDGSSRSPRSRPESASVWRRVSAVSVRAGGRLGGGRDGAPARQSNRIQTAMILGLAFIESLVLFVFVIAVILLFVKS
jgi:hypothetical protein